MEQKGKDITINEGRKKKEKKRCDIGIDIARLRKGIRERMGEETDELYCQEKGFVT